MKERFDDLPNIDFSNSHEVSYACYKYFQPGIYRYWGKYHIIEKRTKIAFIVICIICGIIGVPMLTIGIIFTALDGTSVFSALFITFGGLFTLYFFALWISDFADSWFQITNEGIIQKGIFIKRFKWTDIKKISVVYHTPTPNVVNKSVNKQLFENYPINILLQTDDFDWDLDKFIDAKTEYVDDGAPIGDKKTMVLRYTSELLEIILKYTNYSINPIRVDRYPGRFIYPIQYYIPKIPKETKRKIKELVKSAKREKRQNKTEKNR